VPHDIGLAELDEQGLDAISDVCRFGFPGAWSPTITKVAALYRPHAVPVLDGYVALAFGFARDGFSAYDGGTRRARIGRVVRALASQLQTSRGLLAGLRADIGPLVPEIALISDVRLLDIIIWTAQDDRLLRSGKPADSWLNGAVGERTSIDAVAPLKL